MVGQNTNDMVTGKLILKTRKGKELVVNHIHFPMFDDQLAGAYVQYTYDAPEGERPLVGSISKEDIEDIYCQTVKVLIEICILREMFSVDKEYFESLKDIQHNAKREALLNHPDTVKLKTSIV